MSGNFRTFKLAGGGYADVPEDQLDSWMQEMEAGGVQFQTADVSADMQVGEPEAIKSGPQQSGASGSWEPPPPSMMDRFLEGGRGAMQTGADTLRGGIRGLTMGYGDKLEAGARAAMPGGGSYADEFAQQNRYQDEAAERSPLGYNVAKTLGGAPWDLAAAVGGAPGGLAGEVASSAMLGNLRGAGMSRSPTLEGTLDDANTGTMEGGAWGLGGGVLGRAIGAGSNALSSAAPKVRASALGEVGPAARAQRKLKGDEYVDNLPQAADELGMTPEVPFDWRHPIDSVRQKMTFKSPGDYAEQAQGLMDNVHGPARGQAVAQATREGVSVPRQGLIDELGEQVSAQPNNLDLDPYASGMGRIQEKVPAGKRRSGTQEEPDDLDAQGFADDLEGGDDWISDPQLTATQLDKFKQDMAAGGYKGPDEIQTVSEGIPKRAQRDASRVGRGQLHGAIDEMATDETAQQFHNANNSYEQAASIQNMGRAKQLDLDTQSPFSLPNVGRTLGGMSGGAAIGGSLGGMPGAAVGAVGGFLGNKAVQQYGPDMMADFLRAGPMRDAAVAGTVGSAIGGPMIGGAAAVAGGLGQPGIQAAQGAGQSVYGARDRGDNMVDRFMQQPSSPTDALESGRGHMLTDTVMDMLRNDPQALGQYASQFGQAMGSGGNQQDAIGSMITRLSRTDPNFRTQVLPAIRARTGGM